MEFHPRSQAFSGHELTELVAISPDDDAMRMGFRLQDPEVDDVVRAARDLEAGCIEPDVQLTAEENVELLLRAARLLQLGLEVQFAEAENLVLENNNLRDDMRVLENRNRALDDEVSELRELRDQDGVSGDIRELELELKELRHEFEEERKANEKLIEASDKDKQTIDSLEAKLQRGEELLRAKDDEVLDLREQLNRIRDDFDELRGQYAALTSNGSSKEQHREMTETIRQQEWKIERLTKDNRALEASNCELRSQVDAIKEENLQVSEKILLLDSEARELRLAAAQADDKAEVLMREKAQLAETADELRADVAAKLALLDEFEDKFNRQYRSWEEERSSLTAQVEALRKEARLYVSNKSRGKFGAEDAGGGGGSGADIEGVGEEDDMLSPAAQLNAMKSALDEARGNEVLLLEAYEQLEADVGKEVDRALAKQSEDLARLNRRVQFLEGHLDAERKQVAVLTDEAAKLEGQVADANSRNAQYESGVYGLPQAALEIRQLKETVTAGETRIKELVQQVNKLSASLEDLTDEAVLLRRKAGLPDKPLDILGVKLQKDVTIAQLRSLNALLERQISDLEEERRKLRLEVKFRAKYHGKAALEMGLSPEQLLLLEEYVEGLKGGRNPEERLVTQMQQRIEFLEVRLAEVMAYADIPINMRPALTELHAASTSMGLHAVAGMLSGDGHCPTASADGSNGEYMRGAAGVAGGIKATQVELVRGALMACLKLLRQMSEALAEHRQVSDAEYRQLTDNVIDKLIDAERVTTLLLKDIAATRSSGANLALVATAADRAERLNASLRQHQKALIADDNFVADAAAEELHDRLKQLAKQVVDLQVSLAQKDAQLSQLAQMKATLESRLGLTGSGKDGAAASAAAATRRAGNYVSREQHEELELELSATKEQLLECLEELGAREKELSEMSSACQRYQSNMAELSGQVKMLYQDYAKSAATWKLERSTAEKQLKKAQAEAADATTQLQVFEKAVQVLESGDLDAVMHHYIDAVRKLAVVQLKHAKVARQLACSTTAEKAAAQQVEELQEELQDVSSTCRSRIRWLEQAASDAARRTQQLYRCLQGTAPLEAYQSLVEKHSQLAREHRLLLEQAGDASVSSQAEELLLARKQLAELLPKYDQACDTVAELREKLRQCELPGKLSEKSNNSFLGGMVSSNASRATIPLGPVPGKLSAAAGDAASMVLNEELVAAMVKLNGANRRLDMMEKEKERINAGLSDAQAHAAELEQRLAQVTAELSTSRALEGRLQQRLAASVPLAQFTEVAQRLEAAEAAARHESGAVTALTVRAEEAERKLLQLTDKRQRQLADITNLRTTVRELSSTSDAAAQLGKLHMELDHTRAKESLARSALNRSELERLELERQARTLKQQVASLTLQINVAQDHARWAESELLDALSRLELGLSGHIEAWKASRWANKLEQLKARNDSLAEGMAAAIRRLAKVEDAAQEAQLCSELKEDIQALLSCGMSEVHREATALKEQQVKMKLEAGKLGRAELLMRQKVSYLERVNAELCELLEKCDIEALNQQGELQAEKRELASRVKALQEEVVRLQDRSSGLLAELEEIKTVKSNKAITAKIAANRQAEQDAADAAAKTAATCSVADKELLLKQIDSLKEARTEAEHMRQECHRLQDDVARKQRQLEELQASYDDVLDRLKSQSASLVQALSSGGGLGGPTDETAMAQLRALAEAAIRELQARVKDREAQISELRAKLQEHQQTYLAQHAKDRAEIEALNNKLFESGAASIAGLKANLQRATAVLAAAGDGREEVPYEQLRLLFEERTSECEVLRNRLEQREASLEVMKRNYEGQAQRQDAEMQRLTAALAAAPKEDPNAPNSKLALQKMVTEVRVKDERLRQLRGAIKALEGKLAQLLKDKTDLVMQASSWVEQEHLDERLAELEAQKAELTADLQAMQADLSAARSLLAAQEITLRKLSEQLLKEGDAVVKLKAQLTREQMMVKTLKAKTSKAMEELPAGSQKQLQVQVVQLQQRIVELEEKQRQLQAEVDHLTGINKQLQEQAASGFCNIAETTAKAGDSAVAAAQGMKAIKTGSSPNDSLSQPGTPAAGKTSGLSPNRMPRSSDGGGSTASKVKGGGHPLQKPSRLSYTGSKSSVRPGTATAAEDKIQQQQQLQQDNQPSRENSMSKAAGVSYASQQWEETKQLQAKNDNLRKKLQKKAEELTNLQKDCDRQTSIITALTAEKDKAVAALAATQAKLRKAAQEAVVATPIARVDASKLKEYVLQVLHLEAERDALVVQLGTVKHQQQQQQQPSPVQGSNTKISAAADNCTSLAQEQELFELRLQKEQAVAAVARLKQQLLDLFGPDSPDDAKAAGSASIDTGPSAAVAIGKQSSIDAASTAGGVRVPGRSRNSSGGGGLGRTSGREAELLTTVANLKAALERVMSCSTPNTQYMQEVQQRKAAQKECAGARAELEKLRPQLTASSAQIAELQAANAELRVAVAELKQRGEQSTSAAAVGQLQQQLAQKSAEVAGLRQALEVMQQRLLAAGLQGGNSSSSPNAAGPADVQLQLCILRDRVAALERENGELRSELNAFDPAFFDEIEDMKHSHHQLQQTCAAQARLIGQLQAQLGQSAVSGVH